MRLSDSILSSGRIFCSAGAAHIVKLSDETILVLTSFAPVFSTWPYIMQCNKHSLSKIKKKKKIFLLKYPAAGIEEALTADEFTSVSYTHLTLPTSDLV